MRLRNRSGPPGERDLAVTNPRAAPSKYQAEITDTDHFWGEQVTHAGALGNDALLSIGKNIIGALNLSRSSWNTYARDPYADRRAEGMEFSRRIALSTVAISTLLRHYWEHDMSIIEGVEFIDAEHPEGVILDMVATEPWGDFRVHAPIAIESALPPGATKQWYREGGLWVRQSRPAEPSPYLEQVFLPQLGVDVDFSRYETLTPHLPAR